MPTKPVSENGTGSQALISLTDIMFRRGEDTILDGVTLSVNHNEIVTMIGPNGAGKSTLVKTALGLVRPDSGNIVVKPGLRIGYVPQSVNLDQSLPVSVKRFLELRTPARNEEAVEALEHVGARQLLDKHLANVSGGEMRRILLARALLTNPELLILDEPTSGVDISGQAALYALINSIRTRYRCGVLLVSHNLHIVMAATDRVVCLNRHLCCSGTPEDVQQHPEFVSLFGQQNALALGIYRHHHDHSHDLRGNVSKHPPGEDSDHG
jgi:zinc transport system ATP-binding protein